MAELIPDTVDFRAYMRDTEASVKVRPASAFFDDVAKVLAPKHRGSPRDAYMLSTKVGGALEFRPGEVTCWAGFSGSRKSMFTGQVALDLCVQQQPTMIASFEMLPARTISRMVRQCFGAAHPARASIEAFHRWSDGRLWIFDHFGTIAGAECLAVCRYFADKFDGAHVFIDSMMMVCASEEHIDEQKQFMTGLVRLAQETGLHVHLVAHARKPAGGTEDKPPTKYDVRGSAAITDQAANVITVWANKAKTAALQRNATDEDALAKPDALVTIEKQRNGEFEGRFQLWFDEASMRFMNDRTSAIEPYVLERDGDLL